MGRAQDITLNVFVTCNCEFQISKPFMNLNRPIKGAGKVCGDSQDLKLPGYYFQAVPRESPNTILANLLQARIVTMEQLVVLF